MKRQAAITGPTPPMIQWTLLVDCPLRDLTVTPRAAAAARQLRGLREWTLAKSGGRIRNGICLHENCDPSAKSSRKPEAGEWLGFPEAEPFAVFGGQQRVIDTCSECPANANSGDSEIAGCWGVIPFTEPGNGNRQEREIRLGTGLRMAVPDLADWFGRLMGKRSQTVDFDQLFPLTTPRWYGIWIGSEWNRQQTDWMSGFLETHRAELPSAEMAHLAEAARAACTHKLRLCYDRLPSGNSDSVTWLLQPHCGRCGWLHATRSLCPCCGEHRVPMPEQRKKVMGLRPWLRLAQLYGPDESSRIVEDFQKSRTSNEPD